MNCKCDLVLNGELRCCACCTDEKRAVDSLFIVNWTGTLTEYILEPRVKSGLEKITEESPVEVLARPWAQWPLARLVSACCKAVMTTYANSYRIVTKAE